MLCDMFMFLLMLNVSQVKSSISAKGYWIIKEMYFNSPVASVIFVFFYSLAFNKNPESISLSFTYIFTLYIIQHISGKALF